jgi:hypothetical protein
MTMKRTIFALATTLVVFVAVFAVLVLRPVPKVKAHYGCSKRTLMGYYGLKGFGDQSGSPASLVGLLYFDGNGNLSGSKIYAVVGGFPDSDNPNHFTGATYTVDSDCTMTANNISIFDTTLTAHGVIVDTGGGEVIGDIEDLHDTITATGEIKKVQGWD